MVKDDVTFVIHHSNSKRAGIVMERVTQSYSFFFIVLVHSVKAEGKSMNVRNGDPTPPS
jgi:hypothetical protein